VEPRHDRPATPKPSGSVRPPARAVSARRSRWRRG